MEPALDETHDPAQRSWVASANSPGSDFPLQNLPYAVFRPSGPAQAWRGGVAIGDRILDLAGLAGTGLLQGLAARALQAASGETLNALMALGPEAWHALRLALSCALRDGAPDAERLTPLLLAQDAVEYTLPARVGDYTDFYTSIHHATNAGRLFRPDQPLLPNYKWVPIGYHGRSSTLRISGQGVRRPRGQFLKAGNSEPCVGPSRQLDLELEVGIFIGPGNEAGTPIPMAEAPNHIFGLCLLNDWSARDLQAWEYQPLGPFLAKNFATTLSPWIVTQEALLPYRVPMERPPGDPHPLPYLDNENDRRQGGYDIVLQADLQTEQMRQASLEAFTLCRSNYRHAYWSAAQLVAHHTVNGCSLRPGDLFGSGTLSGPEPSQAAALLEITHGGKRPLSLPGGELRTYLEDGDTVTLSAYCENPGKARIGFGSCRGTVVP